MTYRRLLISKRDEKNCRGWYRAGSAQVGHIWYGHQYSHSLISLCGIITSQDQLQQDRIFSACLSCAGSYHKEVNHVS